MDSSKPSVEEACHTAQADILVKCLGATKFEVTQEGAVICIFEHRSKDDLSNELRTCVLRPNSSPEENLQALLNARAQQRWYQKQRDETQAIPVNAGEKALQAAETAVG